MAAQAALATAAAWVLAQQIFGHERPIFAPVAALIGVSASLGQRRRSAVEMVSASRWGSTSRMRWSC